MPAPAGQEVGLYVDLRDAVAVGDVIETRSGRRYLVALVRVQSRGKHEGRQHLRAVVMDDDAQPGESSRTHRIRWYVRKRGSSRGGFRRRATDPRP